MPCPDPVDDLLAQLSGEEPDPPADRPPDDPPPDPDPRPEPEPPGQPPQGDPPPGGGPGGEEPGGDPGGGRPREEDAPHAVVPRQALVASARGAAALRVTCAGGGVCRGELRLERRSGSARTLLAASPFEVPVGERARVALRLSASARRELARRRRMAVVAVAVTRPNQASERRSAARLTLRLARRR